MKILVCLNLFLKSWLKNNFSDLPCPPGGAVRPVRHQTGPIGRLCCDQAVQRGRCVSQGTAGSGGIHRSAEHIWSEWWFWSGSGSPGDQNDSTVRNGRKFM